MKPFTINLAFLCACIIITENSFASSPIILNDSKEERIFSISQLEFYEDIPGELTIEEVADENFQHLFQLNPLYSKSQVDTRSTYWVKLQIQKNPESEKLWLFEFYDQSIDQIEAYIPRELGKGFEVKNLGDGQSFGLREFAHKNFQIKISNQQEGMDTYYFKIRSSQKADIRIAVRSYDRLLFYALNEYFLYGIFYGMILIISLYNLVTFMAVREMKYLYYIFYLCSAGLFAMSLDGIGFQYFWPNVPEFNMYANGIFKLSVITWAILFTIRFLNTRYKSPLFHYLLLISLAAKVVVFLVGVFYDVRFFEISHIDIVPFLLIFATSIFVYVKGYKSARLFVGAYGVLFVGAVIKVLANTAIIEHNTLVYYSLHIAFLIEMVLLSLALGDRIKIMKQIRDKALRRSLEQYKINVALKEKVNAELESKVQTRTRELERKNQLLEAFNAQLREKDEEIQRINSFLDKDNWKLKSSIKASFQARLDNKEMTYGEFKELFPNKAACCRYLEQLKWEDGFSCRHCGNDKAGKGPKLFTRRCSKCGHIESVTAGTIFHGVRFPLEKAFYITYSLISAQEHHTLEELSETLDLRKNTVWSFRKKVKTQMEARGLPFPQWHELIVEIEPQRE
ncbi:7TM diverse intracellular signaling domain-containing protein [Pleomorphovibrio marinus]|uniref:7TM diverse intracellular signaling domain-containing protein n=1 Tax=Pleomorphovibrio marinus TaxID=2164132 RepID=UPI000E0AA73C|nr:7TM diverse intracellular signaling domain-containing protein [Pleomorphovibrio marinus]